MKECNDDNDNDSDSRTDHSIGPSSQISSRTEQKVEADMLKSNRCFLKVYWPSLLSQSLTGVLATDLLFVGSEHRLSAILHKT